MADSRNNREIVDIGKFKPYTHPQYGEGAIREITYIDGTIERRFLYHGTGSGEGEGPDEGYVVDTRVDPDLRDKWIKNAPPETRTPAQTPEQARTAAANATEAETKAQEATREAAERKRNRELPPDQDPRDETDAQRAARSDARIKQQGVDAQAAEARDRQRKIDEANTANQTANSRRADSAEARAVAEANKVGSKVESLEINGRQYTRITKTSPDGKTVEIENYGPEGTKIASLPAKPPDNPTSPAPRLPNFVLGGSQAALTQLSTELQQGVADGRWSDKWAHERFAEALQIAQQVNQDFATAENARESTMNANVNLATSRATMNQNAMKTALEHVNKINGLLPAGSNLGGQTFAALLGMDLLMQARSGINSIDTSNGLQHQPLPTITAADMQNPAAIEAKRQQVAAQTTAAAQPAAATPPAALAPPASAVPARPVAPAPPAGPPPAAGQGAPAPVAPGVGVNPDAGQALGPTGDSPPLPAAVPPAMKQDAPGTETFGPGQFPGGNVISPVPNPSQYGAGEGDTPTSMAQPSPYAILNQYPGPQAPAPEQPAPPTETPLPLLMSQAQTTPFWKLSNQQIAEMQARGIPQHVIGGPGRPQVA